MEEGVTMASSYLSNTLRIDVSIINVEMVLNIDSTIETDGYLASCFLDAGCACVVIQANGASDNSDGGLAWQSPNNGNVSCNLPLERNCPVKIWLRVYRPCPRPLIKIRDQ